MVCGANITNNYVAGEVKAQINAAKLFKKVIMGTNDSSEIDPIALYLCGASGLNVLNYLGWANMNQGYKRIDSLSVAPHCPQDSYCNNTVTLCDHCLPKEQLGNIMFGVVAVALGLPLKGVTYAVDCLKKLGGKPMCQEKHDAYGLGFAIFSGGGTTSAIQFCTQLNLNLASFPTALDQCNGKGVPGKSYSVCQPCIHHGDGPPSAISSILGECWTPQGGPIC